MYVDAHTAYRTKEVNNGRNLSYVQLNIPYRIVPSQIRSCKRILLTY